MTTLLFSLALIGLTVALIAIGMSVERLFKEIEKVNFELSLLRRQCAEYKQRLDQLEKALELKENFDGEPLNEEAQ